MYKYFEEQNVSSLLVVKLHYHNAMVGGYVDMLHVTDCAFKDKEVGRGWLV